MTDSLLGTVVDQRYVVQSRLARGGMSTVYRATDQRLERDVALKVMHPHLAEDATFLDRFSQEAKSAARLSHAHVVSVLDQGRDGNLVYLVMEYVPGHTLRDVLDEQHRLRPRLALALLDPVIEGLAAAHAAGLVHRDVKPENVLMADDGRIKIGDFGLARAVSTSTSTGTLIGTVAYLAPELVAGGPADARSDIYSVGIMLYEMLTGRHPYVGDVPIQVAYQHVHSAVPAPSERLPGLSSDLDELVQWCTAADPEERPIDGEALLGELRHIRTELSDADLDYAAPADSAEDGAPAGGEGRTTVIELPDDSRTGNATTVLPAARPGQHHTELISRQANPTTMMPRPPGALSPSYDDDGGGSPAAAQRGGRRSEKRQQKAEAKAEARAAARPEVNLRRGNPRRRGFIWLAVIVLLSLLIAAAAWFLGVGPGALTAVPQVADKPVGEAEQLLRESGLDSSITDVHHEEVAQGLVVRSEPAASTEIRKYEPVQLFVSLGPELFEVPNVRGETLEEATALLEESNLAAGEVTEEYHEEQPAGVVLSQGLEPGTEHRRDSGVPLVVSQGPQPIDVPNVVGEPQETAAQVLTDAGLSPSVTGERVFHPDIPAGAVVSQEPAGGQLFRGDTVTLVLSKGPELIEVPDLTGQQVEDATEELENLGFRVEVNNILGGFFGTVRAQDPVNEAVPKGSVITLTVV